MYQEETAPDQIGRAMIYRRRRVAHGIPGSFFTFQDSQNHVVFGPSDGEFIFLRDEFGKQWRGVAERQSDNTIRYRFRDEDGNFISGMSDGGAVTLRDQKGKTWRGFID